METLKTSEAPNEGFLMSELGSDQNSCNETLEKGSGLSTLSEKCNGLVSDPEVSVIENHGGAGISSTVIGNVEFVNHTFGIEKRVEGAEGEGSVSRVAGAIENRKSCFDFGEMQKGSLFDEAVIGESHMKEVFLEPDLDNKAKAVQRGCEMANGDVLVLNSGSPGNGEEEIVVNRVLAGEGLKEMHALRLNGVDSGSLVEASRKGISLFVDVFGPMDDFDQCDVSNSVGEHNNFNLEDECKENGTLFRGTGENTSAMVSEIHVESTANQECRFSVGDFVWAKIKTHLWWPGLICDPSNALLDASKSNKRECLLVRYFGNGSFVQCALPQLKPFLEYFEQMSKQSNSRSFLSAVDKAVGEIGTHVKVEMTCSCFPQENRTKLVAEVKKAELGEFSVKRFEPANFLAYVKDLAKNVSITGVIESTVTQNRLSAFYRTTGHRQLPMHQLVPTTDAVGGANDKAEDHGDSKSRDRRVRRVENDDFGEKNGKSENSYELRERRKSKFSHTEMETSSTREQSVGSDLKLKIQGNKSLRKRSRKPITGHGMSSRPEEIKASSAEMLSELRLTALDCLYPRESKYFDMAERFFSQFRRISFCHESANEQTINTADHCGLKVASGAPDVNQMADTEQKIPLEKGNPLPTVKLNKRGREKKQGRTSVGSKNKPMTELSDMQGNIATSGPMIIDFQNTGPLKPEVQSVPKKRKKAVAAPVSIDGNITTSDSVVINFQKMSPLTPKGQSMPKKRRKKVGATPASSKIEHTSVGLLDMNLNIATDGPMIIDFQKTVRFSPEGQFVMENGTKNVAITPVLPQIRERTDVSAFSGNSRSLLLEDLQFTGFAAPQGKLEPKRRKKKEGTSFKAFDGKSNVVLPDVKGSSAKYVPVLKDVQVKNIPEMSSVECLNEGTLLNANIELTANKPDANGNNAESGSLVKDTQQMSILSPGAEPEVKKRKREEEKSDCETKVAPAIPDLNECTSEFNSTDCIMPIGKPQPKKRRSKAANEVFDLNFSTNRVQTDGEALGTALILKFAAEFPVPSKEALVSTFCGFGQLKESETLALCESSSAQVVFVRSCDARDAFLSLKKCSPFGPALVNYRLHNLSEGNMSVQMFLPIDRLNNPVKPKVLRKPKVPAKPKIAAKPEAAPVAKIPATVSPGLTVQQGEAPDLVRIRQNLEMMTSMMVKAGNNLSPQMRAKLEGEINGLLNKVRTMSGSS